MKQLLILLIFICSYNCQAQCPDTNSGTYLGITGTPDFVGLSITSEIEISFIVVSLQTNLNSVNPTFRSRLGF